MLDCKYADTCRTRTEAENWLRRHHGRMGTWALMNPVPVDKYIADMESAAVCAFCIEKRFCNA